ncbi:hypothetical protein [Ancylobacter pratisalsi]|uniref:Uncharacterized protein n=1 Tax=Ancylobacter pratisalsi TaxID=1745854 RepID=A0A6P1YJ42_9HYPH|nr:hypothetical protein [Ancylobacter pratisalsi]QIB32681.1 hypothetical protein G3A50_02415 [Ancylobacter pratisalsi]
MADVDMGEFIVSELTETFLREFDEAARAAGRLALAKGADLDVTDRDRSRVVGQIRTALIEKGLLRAAGSGGFSAAERGTIEGTDLFVHQAHAKVGRAVVVRASISVPSTLPAANKSRKKLVERLNRVVTATADLFSPAAVREFISSVAVFLLVCPDRRQPDGIGEIAVAIVDHRHDNFVFYEALEKVLARYAPPPVPVADPPLVRKRAGAYQPPEEILPDDDKKHG